MASSQTYADAIAALNSTQTGYKSLEQRRKAGLSLESENPIWQMWIWIRYIGYEPEDLNRLNVLHVAGTKGKGTTCAFTNSILERYRIRATDASSDGGRSSTADNASSETTAAKKGPRKVGLYTSPHLVAVRERICINSEPISEELFTRYFFEVWQAFEAGAAAAGVDPATKPSYFRFLTLMSFHVFMREGVDVAIYETGVGGELDSTNAVIAPAATAITTLGIDHVETLGATIDKIAWHKAGILKAGCHANFTIPQDAAAMKVIEDRAVERKTTVKVLQLEKYYALLKDVRITPSEDFQRKNAALAIALAATALRRIGVDDPNLPDPTAEEDGSGGSFPSLPTEFVDGLEKAVWRGRCETMVTGRQHWYLDGAHNQQSLDVACRWFGRVVEDANKPLEKAPPNVLIFNQQSTRDSMELLRVVHKTIYDNFPGQRFNYAVFCTNVTYKDNSWKVDFVNNNVDPKTLKDLTLQQELAQAWKQLDPTTEVRVVPTIEDAVDFARQIDGGQTGVRVLVTGSFHLIGGAITVLEGDNYAFSTTRISSS